MLNIVVHLCYYDREIKGSFNAISIMWNAFSQEMIGRAKGISCRESGNKRNVASRTQSLPRKQERKEPVIMTLTGDIPKAPVIITPRDKKEILCRIRPSSMTGGRPVGAERALLLRRLYIVLLAVSKRNGAQGKGKYFIEICQGANNRLNISAIASLASFTDYQRKKVPEMLSQLQRLGMIEIDSRNLDRLKIRLLYEEPEDRNDTSESYVDPYSSDFRSTCQALIKLFR